MQKINLGSGYKKYPGYITVDDDPHCNPDYLVNIDDKNLVLPFEDNSIDEILAEHVLEHIGDGFFRLMQEIYRVCKPGAFINILVPTWSHENQQADPTHKRPILVETFRLFSKKHNQLQIDTGGRSSCLGIKYDVDFEIIAFNFVYDSFYDDIIKNSSHEQLVRLMREALNVSIETQIKLVVIK